MEIDRAPVSFLVEGAEEDEILEPGAAEHEAGGDGEVALEEKGLDGVDEDHDELDELERGEVFLPPVHNYDMVMLASMVMLMAKTTIDLH